MSKTPLDWVSQQLFSQVHGRNLVYNTCWEDPRLDRQALELTSDHELMVITSAGCNALDYALDEPRHIYAVDVNPRQNALLELKKAAIRALDYDEFFAMFGEGQLPDAEQTYQQRLRPLLPLHAQLFWDKKMRYFEGGRFLSTFYYHGTSGVFARLMNVYINMRKAREAISAMFEIESPEERKTLYYEQIRSQIWTNAIRRFLGYDATLSMLGVPRPQRQALERDYRGGVVQFMEDCLEAVCTRVPTRDNYFWWLYLFGSYTRERCPEYLKEENFERLKGGLVDKVSTHTTTILDFLVDHGKPIDRFVLLDHMDWLSTYGKPILEAEWQAIADHAAPDARILWRSAAVEVDFVDPIPVTVNNQQRTVGELLTYNTDLAAELHQKDRVHTYASFYIANWAGA